MSYQEPFVRTLAGYCLNPVSHLGDRTVPWDLAKLSTAAAVAPSSVRNHRVIGPRVGAALPREAAAQLPDQADDIALTMVRAYETGIPACGQIADLALQADVQASMYT